MHAIQRVAVVGAELDLRSASVSSWSCNASASRPEGRVAVGQIVHTRSVSRWSGPSSAFRSASVSSRSLRASACRPSVIVDVGQESFMLVSVSG